MAGRQHVAAPGEPRCPAEGCERPAGFATDHAGSGVCRRDDGGRDLNQRTRKRLGLPKQRPAPHPPDPGPSPTPTADPLARRLTGSRATNETTAPLPVLRTVLASARRAGYSFEEAWTIGAEAALSYMTTRSAREWWDALTATEREWADAYARRGSNLAALRQWAS